MTAPARVLLVDDVRLVLTSLRRLLERAGLEVATAESGAEALALLGREEVDLVVADFMMPGMNGIDLLREVATRWPRARRAMLSAQADQDLLDEALANGLVHASFTKPWNNKELVDALRALIAAAASGGRPDKGVGPGHSAPAPPRLPWTE